MKFVFIQCQGLGLEAGNSLRRIASEVAYENLDSDIAYLLNDRGDILCTILKDKEEYESSTNQDRRILNTKNGFYIAWEPNGNCCSIYNQRASHGGGSWLSRIWQGKVALLAASMVIGLLIGYLIGGNSGHFEKHAELKASMVDSPPEKVKGKEEGLKPGIESAGSLDTLEIHSQATRYSHRLKSLSCTSATVNKVSSWYWGLTDEDRKIANKVYPFYRGLPLFRTFFKSNTMDEMSKLLRYRSCFGVEQYEVIKGLCRSSASFQELKGRDFEEAYRIYKLWL